MLVAVLSYCVEKSSAFWIVVSLSTTSPSVCQTAKQVLARHAVVIIFDCLTVAGV